MSPVADTKLGGMTIESRPVIQARPGQLTRFSCFTLGSNGQGIDVVLATEKDLPTGEAGTAYAASIPAVGSEGDTTGYRSAVALEKTLSSLSYVSREGMVAVSLPVNYPGYRDLRGGHEHDVIYVSGLGEISTTVIIWGTSGIVQGVFTLEDYDLAEYVPPLPSWMDLIKKSFEITNEAEVIAFLNQNQFLLTLLREGEQRIKTEFGSDARLILEVVSVPESDDEAELFVLIRTSRSGEDATECLKRLDDRWWLQASRKAQCKMNIDVEVL